MQKMKDLIVYTLSLSVSQIGESVSQIGESVSQNDSNSQSWRKFLEWEKILF